MPEIEFRDGRHYVPDHLADLMVGIETHRMSFEEATRLANDRLVTDRFARARQRLVTEHFRNYPDG